MSIQLVLLGAPGSGKGTQAKRLSGELGFKHLSTGDLLRAEIKKGSDLGNRVTAILEAGNLVDDATVLELLKINCNKDDSNIFDGYPRNIEQAKSLDSVVIGEANHKAVYFDIDLELLVERIVNRRTCGDCGEIYNIVSKKPQVEGTCDKCGGTSLNQRKDDNEETVRNRMSVFSEEIAPILSFYEDKGVLFRVDGTSSPDEIFEKIKTLM